MAPHSSTLAWKIPWTEEPGRLQSMGSLKVGHDWATSLSLFTFMHWRRKWQPTPVSCLENPRDGGAWWAAVSGVTQSRTRLKRLSSSSSRDIDTSSYKYRELSMPVAASATLQCSFIMQTQRTGGPAVGNALSLLHYICSFMYSSQGDFDTRIINFPGLLRLIEVLHLFRVIQMLLGETVLNWAPWTGRCLLEAQLY